MVLTCLGRFQGKISIILLALVFASLMITNWNFFFWMRHVLDRHLYKRYYKASLKKSLEYNTSDEYESKKEKTNNSVTYYGMWAVELMRAFALGWTLFCPRFKWFAHSLDNPKGLLALQVTYDEVTILRSILGTGKSRGKKPNIATLFVNLPAC